PQRRPTAEAASKHGQVAVWSSATLRRANRKAAGALAGRPRYLSIPKKAASCVTSPAEAGTSRGAVAALLSHEGHDVGDVLVQCRNLFACVLLVTLTVELADECS